MKYERVANMAPLAKTQIQEMLWKNNHLRNLGIIPVVYGHSTDNIWVILEKDKLPPKRCSKHGDMMVDKTETDFPYCKEGTLFYRCKVFGCWEDLYPLNPYSQLNKELAGENPPVLLH